LVGVGETGAINDHPKQWIVKANIGVVDPFELAAADVGQAVSRGAENREDNAPNL